MPRLEYEIKNSHINKKTGIPNLEHLEDAFKLYRDHLPENTRSDFNLLKEKYTTPGKFFNELKNY